MKRGPYKIHAMPAYAADYENGTERARIRMPATAPHVVVGPGVMFPADSRLAARHLASALNAAWQAGRGRP